MAWISLSVSFCSPASPIGYGITSSRRTRDQATHPPVSAGASSGQRRLRPVAGDEEPPFEPSCLSLSFSLFFESGSRFGGSAGGDRRGSALRGGSWRGDGSRLGS